jgi:hypothetical protein
MVYINYPFISGEENMLRKTRQWSVKLKKFLDGFLIVGGILLFDPPSFPSKILQFKSR